MKLGQRPGRYTARFSRAATDIAAAQELRHLCFIKETGGVLRPNGRDADDFDDRCEHVLIHDSHDGKLVCCYRMLPLKGGGEINSSYSAQYYELDALNRYDGAMVEMGRFCIHPDVSDPNVLRVAWAAMTRYVDDHNVEMLFGCSSFQGTDSATYLDAFDMLAERHLAPKRWLPRVKAPKVFQFAKQRLQTRDRKMAMLRMPPMLKTYLIMGGWVSDHAVVDDHMNTMHVFTGLEISAIPPARARALRAVAG
ncbi:GNAT family N-acetyltransferase [Aestuariibius sp. HNIBRBA575]|uniref:GNAT family N-acetyltransferase n=1 Tax=Aestuariibius sp. HNIBRBA575 TaxID=3233343 RepID=UPI0034A238B5